MTEEKKQDENFISEEQSKLAKDLLKIIATSDVRLGDRNIQEEPVKYKEVALAMIDRMYKKNIKDGEVELTFQLMRQAISILENAVIASLDMSRNIALKNLWGKDPIDVTLQDIDEAMKNKKDK